MEVHLERNLFHYWYIVYWYLYNVTDFSGKSMMLLGILYARFNKNRCENEQLGLSITVYVFSIAWYRPGN